MIDQSADQIEALRDNLPPPSGPQSPDGPRMPFTTDLELTRQQEDALIHFACEYMDNIEKAMGKKEWSPSGGEFQVVGTETSWLGKRERFTARYYCHVEDRAQPNTIYFDSNLTASFSQRVVAQQVAKSVGIFFGQPEDEDWFTADPIGLDDDELAEDTKRFARYKAAACKVKQNLIEGMEFAWVRGEAVVRSTYQHRFDVYETKMSVLVDAQGNPIKDAYGDYILQDDLWVPETELEVDPQNPDPTAALEVPTGRTVLKRDGVTVMPQTLTWKEDKWARNLTTFKGPDTKIVYYRDFLCPLEAPCIHEADLVAHLYDMDAMQIAQMFGDQIEAGAAKDFEAAVEALMGLLSDTGDPKSGVAQPRTDFAEQIPGTPKNLPRSQLAEVWCRYDADGDGRREHIMLLVDRVRKIPLYYDHVGNMTLRGRRPFEVIRPIAIDGRWYGMGGMEYFDHEQETIDLTINRKNFRDGKSGRVTMWRPYNTLEGERDPNLALNNGGTYTPKPGVKDEEVVGYITLPEVTGESLKEMLDLYLQLGSVKSGTQNPAGDQMAGLPQSDLATGLRIMEDSGNELFSMFVVRLWMGVKSSLEQIIDIIFSRMDPLEVFSFFDGKNNQVVQLKADDVRDLPLNVRLTVARSKDRQTVEGGAAAAGLIDAFYAKPYELQMILRDFYADQLKALRVPHADMLLQPIALALTPTPPPGMPGAQASSGTAGTPPRPAGQA